MIKFHKIRWKNLLSTGNVFTEIKLDEQANTLIIGRNGHGKSTLLDALCLALFGRPFRKINKYNLVNSVNQKDCVVEIEFTTAGHHYMIRRGIAPNIFQIFKDHSPTAIDQEASSPDYQKYLEKNILKFNQKSFSQIVILGSKSFIPFMKLGPYDRRTIIEDLLDIEVFSVMNRVIKNNMITLNNSLVDNKRNIDSTIAQIDMQKKYVEESKKNHQEQINKKQLELDANLIEISNYNELIEELQTDIDKLSESIQYSSFVQRDYAKYNDLLRKIQENKSKTQKEHDFYGNNSNCPTCHQEIDDAFKNRAIQERLNKIKEFDQALIKIEESKNKLLERLEEIQKIQAHIGAQKLKVNEYQQTISHIHKYNKKLQSEITDLSSKHVLSADMITMSQSLIDTLTKETEARKELIDRRSYYDVASNILKDNGIKAKIIKQYLPIINKLVNKYLAAMDFFVNFELDEEFNETIKSRHRDQFTYDSFSEGEKQMIDIALLFAWRAVAKMKNSMNTNLLILDEVFDSSLDTVGADLLLTILNTMPNETNIFLISHRELLNDKFNNIIKFEKRNNFSLIVD